LSKLSKAEGVKTFCGLVRR